MANQTNQFLMYVGTYTTSTSKGIYIYKFDTSTGSMDLLGTHTGVENPSFLSIGPQGRYLYSVGEVGDVFSGNEPGSVHAFAIDGATGELDPLNYQPAGGAGTCHITVDNTGLYVLVANYGSGSVTNPRRRLSRGSYQRHKTRRIKH